MDFESETFIAHALRGNGFDASEDGTGRGTPIAPVAFSCKDHGADAGDIAPTLRSMGHDRSHANAGGQLAVCFDTTQITSAANRSNPQPGDPCHPLASQAHPPAITVPILEAGARTGASTTDPRVGMGVGANGDPMLTLQSGKQHAVGVSLRGREGGGTAELGDECGNALRASGGGGDKAHVLAGMAVRRLTVEECEALQGFSRGYTAIQYRGKPAADGPRYRAIGNSMAVPVVRWIIDRIEKELTR